MRVLRLWSGTIALSVMWMGSSPVMAADREAREVLEAIDALKTPVADPAQDNDRAYVAEFWKRMHVVTMQRAELIGELRRVDPTNPRLATLLPIRWRALSGRLMSSDVTEDVPALLREVDNARAEATDSRLRVEAAYLRAWIVSDFRNRPGAASDYLGKARAVDAFIAFAPGDERGAGLLEMLTLAAANDPARRRLLNERIVRDYASTKYAATARGVLGKLDRVGQPFDLAFHEATTNALVLTQSMLGKVIVVDF